MASGRSCYDVSSEQREILEFKTARRLRLRNEYLKDVFNPFQTQLQNEALLRFQGVRNKTRHNPSVQSVLSGIAVTMAIIGLTVILNKVHNAKEKECRSGTKSYLERCGI